MDKQFWAAIVKNDFAMPEGHAVLTLTDELFDTIGSTDPELRDTIGLEIFYHWLKNGLYHADDLRRFSSTLMNNLQKGIGEIEGDSVFLRSFSALWLSLIIDNSNETMALDGKDIAPLTEAALAYFAAENDMRGYVAVKGYAHAIAHAADLLGALAGCSLTDASDHIKMLDCIAKKLEASTREVYLYNEDSRLARAVARILVRNTLSMEQIKDWLTALAAPWNGAWQNKELARAYHNGRDFLRSLYLQISMAQVEKLPNEEKLLELLKKTLEQATPWEWAEKE